MKQIYLNFVSAFHFDEDRKKRLFKLSIILIFGPVFTAFFITMLILLSLNKYINILMKISVSILLHFYKEYETIKKLLALLFFGSFLLPFIFALYVSVIVVRILFNVLGKLYSMLFFIVTIPNKVLIKNYMESYILENQKNDIF